MNRRRDESDPEEEYENLAETKTTKENEKKERERKERGRNKSRGSK